MPAPKSRQGGPGSAGPALKHLNPTVAERKVEFEVSVARHTLLAASSPRRALGTNPHAARCGDLTRRGLGVRRPRDATRRLRRCHRALHTGFHHPTTLTLC